MTKEQESYKMNKADLIEWITKYDDYEHKPTLLKTISDFFSQNVVIPKGVNRHPYADVYHEAVEGKDWQWSEDGVNWYDVVPPRYQYRIKPAEPEFEYQWLVIYKNSNSVRDFLNYQNYMTVLEASNHYVSKLDTRIYNIVKIEETKRERHEKH